MSLLISITTPINIPDLFLWWDASLLSGSAGSNVTNIADKSGNGRDGSYNSGFLPPKISTETLNGGYKCLENNKTSTTNSAAQFIEYSVGTITPTLMSYTIIVKSTIDGTIGARVVGLSGTYDYGLRIVNSGYTVVMTDPSGIISIICDITQWNIITVVWNDTSVTAYLNGTLVGGASVTSSGEQTTTVRWLATSGLGQTFSSKSPEFILHNRSLTKVEVLKMHRYLKFKYGL